MLKARAINNIMLGLQKEKYCPEFRFLLYFSLCHLIVASCHYGSFPKIRTSIYEEEQRQLKALIRLLQENRQFDLKIKSSFKHVR